MLKIYDCVAAVHDMRLVTLAVAVCALSSYAAFDLLGHARNSSGTSRKAWLAVSASAIGFGTWATHFIAMLAFAPNVPSGYEIDRTVLALMAAIAVTGTGLWIGTRSRTAAGLALGGAVIGGGVAAMHFIGMAAYEIAGSLQWDAAFVAASLAMGIGFGALSLPIGLRKKSGAWKSVGALLLTLAICSHHFTAMSGVTIVPDPRIVVSDMSLNPGWIAVYVSLAGFTIILMALVGLALDLCERRRRRIENERIKGLANAAVEGLLVCDGDRIITVNNSLGALIGIASEQLISARIAPGLLDEPQWQRLKANPGTTIEAELSHADGSKIPVELILHRINVGDRAHDALAIRDLRARKRNEEHIRFLAQHDSLTGLPNRCHLNARIDEEILLASTRQDKLAVLCIDLDRFKDINDLFGQSAGDAMLKAVASRSAAILSGTQMIARSGGDEFAVLLPSVTASEAGDIAEALMAELHKSSDRPDGGTIPCSIGIAMFPEDGADRQTLLTNAGTALYRAKANGRGTCCFFEAAMGIAVSERRHLERDLRLAIERHELKLFYQPQKNIETGEIVGFEALLRWTHSTRGDVPPSVFIPLAEESDLILEIGQWVLTTACREAASWTKPLTIAVNVSAAQLYQPQFLLDLHQTLLDNGLPAQRLELEITETALIRDFARALQTLRGVKALGSSVAMDDFGTGYSSLSNLRVFPFDKIKIDRSFITSVSTNAQAATIVRAVIGLGRGLGLSVIAEGVETHEDYAFLRDERCNEAQGYLIGRPAAITAFDALTRRHVADPASPTIAPAAMQEVA